MRFFLVLIFSMANSGWAMEIGQPFPEVSLKHIESGTLTTQDMLGKVTVVNIWATWCGVCKIEMSEMEDEFRPLTMENDFQIAFVSVDEDPELAMVWFERNLKSADDMLRFLYSDPSGILVDQLKIDAYPTTFIVDQSGTVMFQQKGYAPGNQSTRRLVQYVELLRKAHSK